MFFFDPLGPCWLRSPRICHFFCTSASGMIPTKTQPYLRSTVCATNSSSKHGKRFDGLDKWLGCIWHWKVKSTCLQYSIYWVQSPKTFFLGMAIIHINVNVAFTLFPTVQIRFSNSEWGLRTPNRSKEGNGFCKKKDTFYTCSPRSAGPNFWWCSTRFAPSSAKVARTGTNWFYLILSMSSCQEFPKCLMTLW